jgi:hypothetical protein
MDGFFKTKMCGRIRIKRSRKISSQPLCDEYLSWVSYLFFGRSEEFH